MAYKHLRKVTEKLSPADKKQTFHYGLYWANNEMNQKSLKTFDN